VAEKDVVDEFARVMDMHRYYYKKLGIKNFKVKLGIRDPKNLRKKYQGDDKMWAKAEKLTRAGLKKARVKYSEDVGGAAGYLLRYYRDESRDKGGTIQELNCDVLEKIVANDMAYLITGIY